MTLRLTTTEVDLLKEALAAYAKVLNDKARPLCTGYSAEGIALCCRRLEAEALAAHIQKSAPRVYAFENCKPRSATSHFPVIVPLPERAA